MKQNNQKKKIQDLHRKAFNVEGKNHGPNSKLNPLFIKPKCNRSQVTYELEINNKKMPKLFSLLKSHNTL